MARWIRESRQSPSVASPRNDSESMNTDSDHDPRTFTVEQFPEEPEIWWQETARMFCTNKAAVAGAASLALIVLVGTFGPIILAADPFAMVGAPLRGREYPHQLSGGMRRRVMIAMALACEPTVLLADEPTTTLDVTVQAQIFDLLKEIQETHGTCIVLITHDFGAVSEMADRVLVMHAGHKVEEGTLDEISDDARHPYTQGLLRSMPEIVDDPADVRVRLPEIPGTVPDLLRGLVGCPFAPRCPSAMSRCRELPGYSRLGEHRCVKCWLESDGEGDHTRP